MLKRGPTINRAGTFLDAVRALESEFHGVQAAVDHFIEALRAGGGSLAIRPVDGRSVHRADNPSAGSSGREQFGIQLVRKTTTDGAVTFTLIDIWARRHGLPETD
jgi:hypothetical protein